MATTRRYTPGNIRDSLIFSRRISCMVTCAGNISEEITKPNLDNTQLNRFLDSAKGDLPCCGTGILYYYCVATRISPAGRQVP